MNVITWSCPIAVFCRLGKIFSLWVESNYNFWILVIVAIVDNRYRVFYNYTYTRVKIWKYSNCYFSCKQFHIRNNKNILVHLQTWDTDLTRDLQSLKKNGSWQILAFCWLSKYSKTWHNPNQDFIYLLTPCYLSRVYKWHTVPMYECWHSWEFPFWSEDR